MKAKSPSLQINSFAHGVKMANTRGALISPVRLTKAHGRILARYIDEFKQNWYCTHDDEGDDTYKQEEKLMQESMQWILNQVNKRWSQNELYSEFNKQK